MGFGASGRSVFPLLPPYGAHDPSNGRIIALHPDDLTPYLGLRARLSQVWINRWTILILLVLVRVLIAIGDVRHDMANARSEALSACTSVESMGSALASMPHYLSEGVNDLAASAINAPLNVAMTVMMDLLIVIPSLIYFFIKFMLGEYICLGTWATDAVLDEVKDSIGNVTNKIEGVISDGIGDVTSFMNKVESAKKELEKGTSLIGSVIAQIPDFDSGTINKINSWNDTADNFLEDITKEIQNIPNLTFQSVMGDIKKVVYEPFDFAINSLNTTKQTHQFDKSQLWTPPKKQLEFCGENDGFKGINDFFNGVTDIAVTARKIFIAVLVAAAILACVPSAIQEIRGWRHMKERAELVRKEADDPMDVVYRVSRPYTAAAGIKAAGNFSNSRRQTLVRWVVAYATSLPALFVLAIAIAALLSCLCQYIVLRAISHTIPELSAEVGDFAEKVVQTLTNTSVEWANYANGNATAWESSFNDGFSDTIHNLTSSLDSLDPITNKISEGVDNVWGDTIFSGLVRQIQNCTADIAGDIKKGLQWAQDHAKIPFPTFPNDTFSAGAQNSIDGGSESFLSNPGDVTSDKISEDVNKVISALEKALLFETYIALAILLLWVFIVLIGVARAMFLWWGHDRNRGDGGGHAMEVMPTGPAPPPPHMGGFDEVPLTAMPKEASGPAPVVLQPAPAPATRGVQAADTAENPFNDTHTYSNEKHAGGSENPFHDAHSYVDEKLRFAGQRNLGTVQAASDPSLRKSSYVEYDMKG